MNKAHYPIRKCYTVLCCKTLCTCMICSQAQAASCSVYVALDARTLRSSVAKLIFPEDADSGHQISRLGFMSIVATENHLATQPTALRLFWDMGENIALINYSS